MKHLIMAGLIALAGCSTTVAVVENQNSVYRFYEKPFTEANTKVEKCQKVGNALTGCQKIGIQHRF